MRIIAGKWRGLKLEELGTAASIPSLRPSSDRLRETLFNILAHERYGFAPRDMRVLDLFAGSGALGFEALSRGANFACFVEQAANATSLIRRNMEKLAAQASSQLINADSLALDRNEAAPFDLVFLDPPYGKGLGEEALRCALAGGWVAPRALIIWEEELSPRPPKGVRLLDARKIGRAVLGIYRFGDDG